DGGCGAVSEVGTGIASETVVTSDSGCGAGSRVAAELASAPRVVAAWDIAASMASRLGGSAGAGAAVAGGRGGCGAWIPCWTSGSLALMRTQMLESGSTGSTLRCRLPNPRSPRWGLAAEAAYAPNQLRAPARPSK